jgi:hypothetical protein
MILERAVQALQSIAGQNGLSKAQLERYLGVLLDLGLVRMVATTDGTTYQLTKDGYRFLQEYQAQATSESAFRIEIDRVLDRILKNQVTVIIPTLNEAEAIGGVVGEVLAEGYKRVVVVDGYSTDLTAEEAKRAGASVIYQHSSGKSGAVKTGIENAETPYILFMDGDGTYDPKDIGRLLNHSDHYAHIIGARDRKHATIARRFGNWVISKTFSALFSVKTEDVCSGMYLLETNRAKRYELEEPGFNVEVELAAISASNGTLTEVPITYRPRLGQSKLKAWQGLSILVGAYAVARRYNPILIYSGLAGLSIIPAAIILAWTIYEQLTARIWHSGWALMGVMLLLVAAQAFTLAGVSMLIKHSLRQMTREIRRMRATS